MVFFLFMYYNLFQVKLKMHISTSKLISRCPISTVVQRTSLSPSFTQNKEVIEHLLWSRPVLSTGSEIKMRLVPAFFSELLVWEMPYNDENKN